MSKFNDLTGQRFGRLTVLGQYDNPKSGRRWVCKCDCGNESIAFGKGLKKGTTRSCGCYRKEVTAKNKTTHGMKHTRQYMVWNKMKDRCLNPKARAYKHYGGRGIKVCDKWLTFEGFWEDMSEGYDDNLTIERIDHEGDYEPSNCTWITQAEQTRNTRHNRLITFKGKTRILAEQAERYGLAPSTVATRLKLGWSLEDVFETPLNKHRWKMVSVDGLTETIPKLAEIYGKDARVVHRRIELGWSIEESLKKPVKKYKKRKVNTGV